jgi:hypothetical protein
VEAWLSSPDRRLTELVKGDVFVALHDGPGDAETVARA